jgi:hypothetical protein
MIIGTRGSYNEIMESGENSSVLQRTVEWFKWNKEKAFGIIGLSLLIIAAVVQTANSMNYFASTQRYRIVMHISDTHIDPMFDASMSMSTGVCHSCDLSTRINGDRASCPRDFLPDSTQIRSRTRAGYAFGMYDECFLLHVHFISNSQVAMGAILHIYYLHLYVLKCVSSILIPM